MATCSNCGNDLMPRDRFCTRCGTRVATANIDRPVTAAAGAEVAQPAPRHGSAFLGGMFGALGAGIGCLLLLGLLFAGCVALLNNVH